MRSVWDPQFIDNLAVLGFIVGILNYDENLSQSDKDDLMQQFDTQTKELLTDLHKEISEQNRMLAHIIERLERLENREVD